jgi:hypothetical protein
MMRVASKIIGGCFVALIGVSTGYAQEPSPQQAKVKTVPKLDAEALRIPDSIHSTQAKKIEKSDKPLATPSLPNKVDLGKYDLEFRAKHSSEVNPRTGFDSGEKSVLSNSAVGRKSDSALPNYFGLKLSTPTN